MDARATIRPAAVSILTLLRDLPDFFGSLAFVAGFATDPTISASRAAENSSFVSALMSDHRLTKDAFECSLDNRASRSFVFLRIAKRSPMCREQIDGHSFEVAK